MQAAGTCRLLTARVGPSWLRVGVGGVSSLPISAPARRSASSTARPLESPAVLSLECTSISVGSPARTLVEQLSLTIREGEVWAVLGATGCGKTTLSQLMGDRLCANVPTQKRSALFDSISFDAHQRLLQQEVMEYRESRCDSRYMRATVASFLCPHLYPEGMTMDGEGVVEFPRPRSNLSALPIRYDEPSDSPLLATLESGVSTGLVSDLLRHLGLHDQRHSPLHGLSTGEGRKLMLIKALLQPPKLLVLDEAFDGLDVRTRAELGGVLRKVYSGEGANSSVVLIAHRIEDLLIEPSHVLMLGAGEDGTAYVKGTWHEMAHSVRALFAAQQANQPKIDLSTKIVTQDDTADESIPLLEFRGVTVKYPRKTVFEGLCWTVLKGSKWVVAGANGSGKSTLLDLITGENLQGYKNDIRLFGKKKGAGVSIWEVKEKLGVVSSKLHMSYLDLCAVSSAEKRKIWSTWDVRAESAENHWAPILVCDRPPGYSGRLCAPDFLIALAWYALL